MDLLPIRPTLEENPDFAQNPDCAESLAPSIGYYDIIGFDPPWICYYASENGQLVGSAAFKGGPKNGKVELAYGTFERFRQQGIGTRICTALVALAQQTDPAITITARTLPEKNHSTRILEKNSFKLLGTITDPDDGEVWEWEYQPAAS